MGAMESTPERPEIEVLDQDESADADVESVERPAKVMRIGTMIKQLLDEVRIAPLDDASRARMKEIYETSVRELSSTLSPDLAAELGRMTIAFDSPAPSEAELRVAQAQLVGWLEGLFHGIQASLFAQQMALRGQMEQAQRQMLPPGAQPAGAVVGEPGVPGQAGYL